MAVVYKMLLNHVKKLFLKIIVIRTKNNNNNNKPKLASKGLGRVRMVDFFNKISLSFNM